MNELSFIKPFSIHSNAKDMLDYYQKYQVLHIKDYISLKKKYLTDQHNIYNLNMNSIKQLYRTNPSMVENTFTIETKVNSNGYKNLKCGDIYSETSEPVNENDTWYSSFIIQQSDMNNQDISSNSIRNFIQKLPVHTIPALEGSPTQHIYYTAPIWVFIGKNYNKNTNTSVGNKHSTTSKYMQWEQSGVYIHGRPEHTDSVSHDGTFHMQCEGNKIWYIRPSDSHEWGRDRPHIHVNVDGANRGATGSNPKGMKASKLSNCMNLNGTDRLVVNVEAGDLFVLNTRLWWHETRIPAAASRRSYCISYAIDFYGAHLRKPGNTMDTAMYDELANRKSEMGNGGNTINNSVEYTNIDGLYASRDLLAGDIVLLEEDMPDCELPRSDDPTCEVGYLEDGSGCIIAVKDLSVGDWLTVAPSDSEEESDEEGNDSEEDIPMCIEC